MMTRREGVTVVLVALLSAISAYAQTPPNPPSNLVATAFSDTQINLTWSDTSTNEDGFKIERAPNSSGSPGSWTEFATVGVNVTSCSDTGLLQNATYWYRVRAYNGGGVSAYGNQTNATTFILCPRLVVGWGSNASGQATPPTNLAGVVAIAAGLQHSLALKSDGTVVGWGYNFNGQATPPTGLTSVVAISAADFFSVALRSNGTVVQWGFGSAPPPGLSNVVAISAAYMHCLALKQDGTVTNWGSGSSLSLLSNIVAISAGSYHDLFLKSNGTILDYNFGTPPSGATSLVAIAAGPYYSLALKGDGTVIGWNGAPTVPAGLSNVIAIAAGQNYCLALKVDGTVVGWGSVPATMPTGLTNVIAIAAGGSHCLALTLPCPHSAPSALTATAVSWNQINLTWQDNSIEEDGFKIDRATSAAGPWIQIAQVLRNTTTYRNGSLMPGATCYYRVRPFNSTGDWDPSNVASATTPALGPVSVVGWSSGFPPVPTLATGLVAIADGGNYGLGLRNDGIVVSWNGFTPPGNLSNVVAIAANFPHSLALRSDGIVVGWGGGPQPPSYLSNAVAIAAGTFHSLALRSGGTVVGWGNNQYGQTNPPAGLAGVVAIAAGDSFSLALKSDGTVIGWGNNQYGQTTPPGWLRNVVAIAAGQLHSLALRSDGTVVGWGNNQYGQTNTPAGLAGVVAIAAGDLHSLALKSDGTVVGWGEDFAGQTNSPAGLTGVVAISGCLYHSLALSTAPYAPSLLTAVAVATNQINLSWIDNSLTEVRFGIEKSLTLNGPWTEIDSVNSNVTTYSDIVPSCGSTYYYRVRAYDTILGSPYSSVVAASSSTADTDSDGVADCWMIRYFGHPTGQTNDNSMAQADRDGDGLSNLQEFLTGTDPTNNASAFRIIAVAREGDDLRVTWTTAGAHTNAVQAAPDLASGFSDLNPYHIIPGSGDAITNYLDVGGATNTPTRLYRVRLVP